MASFDPRRQDAAKHTLWLLRAFERGKTSSDELFHMLLGHLFYIDEDVWEEGLLALPAPLRPRFVEFLKSYLIPQDFMPPYGVVFPPPRTEEEIKAVKEARRPRYIKLFHYIEEVCSGAPVQRDLTTE
jgi:hypothetical protein